MSVPTGQGRLTFYSPGAVNPGDLGKPATGFINPDGSITGFNDYATDPATTLVRGEMGNVGQHYYQWRYQQ